MTDQFLQTCSRTFAELMEEEVPTETLVPHLAGVPVADIIAPFPPWRRLQPLPGPPAARPPKPAPRTPPKAPVLKRPTSASPSSPSVSPASLEVDDDCYDDDDLAVASVKSQYEPICFYIEFGFFAFQLEFSCRSFIVKWCCCNTLLHLSLLNGVAVILFMSQAALASAHAAAQDDLTEAKVEEEEGELQEEGE